ncbi:MAG TPA: hypothetical protein VIQ31_34170 [Phormidium sp.]
MKKLPHSTKAQLHVATKIKYKEISLNVSLANQILDACCEHLQAKYPELSIDKALEIAVLQSGNLINTPEFLFKDLDR